MAAAAAAVGAGCTLHLQADEVRWSELRLQAGSASQQAELYRGGRLVCTLLLAWPGHPEPVGTVARHLTVLGAAPAQFQAQDQAQALAHGHPVALPLDELGC
jgi:hypothetical protein